MTSGEPLRDAAKRLAYHAHEDCRVTCNMCRRQLGHGDLKDRTKPTSVRRLWEMQLFKTRRGETFKPVAVAAGHFHTLVLVERGSTLQGAHGPWQQVVL